MCYFEFMFKINCKSVIVGKSQADSQKFFELIYHMHIQQKYLHVRLIIRNNYLSHEEGTFIGFYMHFYGY